MNEANEQEEFSVKKNLPFAKLGKVLVRKDHITTLTMEVKRGDNPLKKYCVVITLINGEKLEYGYPTVESAKVVLESICANL